jgi:hypothetical protein
VDPVADQLHPLWWVITYRDGTVRRQYEVRGDRLIQTRFGSLPRTGILNMDIQNGPPWNCVRQWRIGVPIGAEAEVHLDGAIVLNSDVELCRKRKKSGKLIMPGAQRIVFHVVRHQTYTFGWTLMQSGVGEYLHVAVDGDNAQAWANHLCFV